MYDRFEQLLQEKQITAYKVAKDTKVDNSTLSKWKAGVITPSFQNLTRIAKYFDVSLDWLTGDSDERQLSSEWDAEYNQNGKLSDSLKRTDVLVVPILGVVPAGVPIEAIENVIDYLELEPSYIKDGVEYFALTVRGDSMSPKYVENDIVIVQITDDAPSGTDVIAYVNGFDATLKQLIKYENGNIELRALNPSYESKVYSSDETVGVCGVVRELRRKINLQ